MRLSNIIAAIVVMSVLVILEFAVIFVSTQPSNQPVRLIVTFGGNTQGGVNPNLTAVWYVAGCTENLAFRAFRIQMTRNNVPLVAVALILSANTVISFGSVKAIVSDDDQDRLLSPGDDFMVYGMESGHEYWFSLIWGADGEVVSAAHIST